MVNMKNYFTRLFYKWELLGNKWKFLIHVRYWNRKYPTEVQFGDFVSYTEDDRDSDTRSAFLDIFSFQIVELMLLQRAEIIGKIHLIHKVAVPTSSDPLGQAGCYGWKGRFLLHTRRSWRVYIRKQLRTSIRFDKEYKNGR